MSAKRDQQLDEISKKLDMLIRLSALNLVKDMKVQKDQIAVLSDAGFPPKQIADILGTTSNTVNVGLHGIRREREAKAKKEAAKPEVTSGGETTSEEETKEDDNEQRQGAES